MTRSILGTIAAALAATASFGQDAKPAGVKSAPSRVSAVTVYKTTALVTREVTPPDAIGQTEVIVSPLPTSTMPSSLYAEGADGIRVMSTRFRTRAIAEDTREEVRKLETRTRELNRKLQVLQGEIRASELNAALLTKLETFTTATLLHLTDGGKLDSDKTISLVNFIRENRSKLIADEVGTKQQIEDLQTEIAFQQRLLAEKSNGPARTERDAIIVIDKTKAGPVSLRLNYLVADAAWRPQYKLRAGIKANDPVTVEYLAGVSQKTGEDWNGVSITLSTAQPLLNASPPDLRALELAIGGSGGTLVAGQMPPSNLPAGPGGFGGMQGGGGRGGATMPSRTSLLKDLAERSKALKGQAVQNFNSSQAEAGGRYANDAAAIDQYRDLLLTKEELQAGDQLAGGFVGDEPSVAYALKTKMALPSRNDEQVLEIGRLDLAAKFYYKAVPVLSPNVYRIADLTNTTEMVFLAGEATMYIGTDFVGQTKMPLVAVGKPFTVGFGVDPQLQVTRKLIDKTRTTQGGNQVLKFDYRILLSSYKTTPVDVQVWDRMPHAEAAQAIAVSMTPDKSTPLSTDALYVRDEKPKNLLRWDVKVDPKQNGGNAFTLDYQFKLELDKNVNIAAFQAK
ncbi:MAG TPA: mucoidy inhibitor MuiA family protein [Fimbriiglobus sp.]|jgi:hypothetical protein